MEMETVRQDGDGVGDCAVAEVKSRGEGKAQYSFKRQQNRHGWRWRWKWRTRGGGGGASETEQSILEVLDFCPKTKMKSRASSSTFTPFLRPFVDRSSARQVVCDQGLAARFHVSTSELNPRRSPVVVEQEPAFF
ncbi:hypothetical protein SLEP1_g8983 [Rubroshorea leprosula]|uniref:Uncharacterized protein n=1 Tax=Rubroshorea leprosula TaxID=152421 RepID=A0AAV5I815_9ROSI|nr:hypothetical protein SLEP1_g8983 [Rubroshorea leprosula]